MKPLLPALFASAALHAAAFVTVYATVSGSVPPKAAPAPASVEPASVEPASVEIDVFGPGPALAAPPERAMPSVPAHALAHRMSRRPKLVPAPNETTAAPPSPAAVTPASRVETVSAPAIGGAPQIAKAGTLDLTAFFQRLQSAAQRCSGPRAGEGKVRFCVDAAGAPVEVSLVRSTGNFALDDAALHCVIPGAAPFPHTDRCLVVPLRFQ